MQEFRELLQGVLDSSPVLAIKFQALLQQAPPSLTLREVLLGQADSESPASPPECDRGRSLRESELTPPSRHPSPDRCTSPASSEMDVHIESSSGDCSDASSSSEDFVAVSGKRKKGKRSPPPTSAPKAKKATTAALPAQQGRPASPTPGCSRDTQPSPLPATSRPASPMADSQSPPASQNPSQSKKLKAPPPIYIQDKSMWTSVSKLCAEQRVRYTSARTTQQGIKVTVPAAADYRSLSALLRGKQIAFHTYSLPEEKPTRVVIRGVPKEIGTEEVLADLRAQAVPVAAVHRLHHARGQVKYDMVLVVCDPVEGHHPIFKVKTVCSLMGIQIEKPRKANTIGQCHRCQLYGHSQAHCFAPHRCVKCLGGHSTADCPRPKDKSLCTEPPSCVLCGQSGHPANYRGCPKAPKAPSAAMAKRHNARQQREAPVTAAPSAQMPDRLSPQRPSPWSALNHKRAFPSFGPAAAKLPGLMDVVVPKPQGFETAAAPSQEVAPVAAAANPCRSPPAPPVRQAKEMSIDVIFAHYGAFVTPEADRMAAELKAANNKASKVLEIFHAYPDIGEALSKLDFKA